MIENYGKSLEFKNQTQSAELNLEWYASCTHNIINTNIMNRVPVPQKK